MSFELTPYEEKVAHALERDALEALVPIVVKNFSTQKLGEILTSSLSTEDLGQVIASEKVLNNLTPAQINDLLQKLKKLAPAQDTDESGETE